MSLIFATGANIGDPVSQLNKARKTLSSHFHFQAQSRIYQSKAQDYLDQPDFFNQVLEFKLPSLTPMQVLTIAMNIEALLGRQRDIPRGPRLIDIDILFYGLEKFQSDSLEIPHPRLWQRSFVIKPLSEIPYYDVLKHHFKFSDNFIDDAFPLQEQKD